MQIVDFTEQHVAAAEGLARDNYQEEQAMIGCLPESPEWPGLSEPAGNGLGVAAVEDGRLIGFWGCLGPWEDQFGSKARGVFSPMHAHGAVREQRDVIYRRMYQSLAEKLAQRGIAYHSIALYAHDQPALSGLFTYGFGMRCVDAVRPMEEIFPDETHSDGRNPGKAHLDGTCMDGIAARGMLREKAVPDAQTAGQVTCRESGREDLPAIRNMRAGLGRHLGESPCFIKMSDEDIERWQRRKESGGGRVFTAWQGEEPAAYLEITDGGENFATEAAEMQNICGAYCVPAHRGQGIMPLLLNFVIRTLRAEGYTLLGVDFESINPNAWGFWNKHFKAYTYGLTRRLVESACRTTEPLMP